MDVFFWAIDPRVAFWTRFEANFRLGGNQGPLFLNGLTSPRVPGQLRILLKSTTRERQKRRPFRILLAGEGSSGRTYSAPETARVTLLMEKHTAGCRFTRPLAVAVEEGSSDSQRPDRPRSRSGRWSTRRRSALARCDLYAFRVNRWASNT